MNRKRRTEVLPGKAEFERNAVRRILMQFAFLFLAGFFAAATSASAQTVYYSNGTGGGGWMTLSTWKGSPTTPPDSLDDVVISAGDSVYTNPTASVGCHNIEIQSGAILTVLGSTAGGGMTVKGTFTIDKNAWFYNAYSSLTGWPDNAASYSIDPASNYVLTPASSSTFGANTADSTFGNVIVERTSGTSAGANLTIQGNLIIESGSTGPVFRGIAVATAPTPSETFVHHVMGNVDVISGTFAAADGDLAGMICIWNIDGNVTIGDSSTADKQARFGPFSSSNADSKVGVFNIGGNLSLVNGGRLQCGTSSGDNATTETGVINLKGNFYMDSKAYTASNSFGQFAINFVGNKTQTVSLGSPLGFSPNSGGAFPTFCDTVAAGAKVVFDGGVNWGAVSGSPYEPANGWGSWVVNGTLMLSPTDTITGNQTFAVNKGGTLGVGSVDGITTTATQGNIQVAATRTYSTEGNYTYDGTAAQAVGNGLPATVNNLSIMNPAGVTLAGNTTVAGDLTLSGGGKLMLGSQTLTVSNPAANAVAGDSASYVVGSLTRALGTATGAYQFPIGTSTDYRGATLNYTTAPSAASNLTASFTAADPTNNGFPAGISGYWNGGYWTVASSGTPGGVYNLSVYAKGVPSIDTGSVSLMNKAALTDAWKASGQSGSVSGNYVTENGVSALGIFGVGYGTATGVIQRVSGVPTRIAIANFPNPFNPTTQLQFAVPKNSHVVLNVYNVLGQKVATLVDQNMTPGIYQRVFDGSRYASGIYFARLSVDNHVVMDKMLMIK